MKVRRPELLPFSTSNFLQSLDSDHVAKSLPFASRPRVRFGIRKNDAALSPREIFGETARRKYRGMRKHRTVVVAKKRAMGAGSQLDRALDNRARASAINSGAGGCGPLAGKKKRALAVDPGLPIRPPNLGGTGRAVASSLLRSGGAVESTT